MDLLPINGQTWLICGGRTFRDERMFNAAMGDLIRLRGIPSKVVEGGNRTREGDKLVGGADWFAYLWAHRMAVECATVAAVWKQHGKAAGPLRNQQMLDEHQPSFAVAFPGGKGTADMVRRLKAAGIELAEVSAAHTVEAA